MMSLKKSEKKQCREQICEAIRGVDIDQPPLVHGHMLKMGSSRLGLYNKRYFALYEGVLIYYKHEKDYEKDKKNGLKNCKLLKLGGVYLTRPEVTSNRAKHCFKLHLPDKFNQRSEIMLVTANRKAKNIWIELLQQQNPSLLPPSHEEDLSLKPVYIQRLRSMTASADTTLHTSKSSP